MIHVQMQINIFHVKYLRNLLILLFVCKITALPGLGQNNLHLSLDLAQFQDIKRQPYLEIYYAMAGQSDTYVPGPNGEYTCRLVMNLQIYKQDSLWASKIWRIDNTIEDTTLLDKSQQMLDMFRYYLDEPDVYRTVIYARDMNREGAIDSIDTQIESRRFSPDKLELSDVQLASQIRRINQQSSEAFAKHKYEVIPNPTLVFGENVPMLSYYFEAYNLLNNVPGRKYKCITYLKDSNGKIVGGLGSRFRNKKKLYDMSVEIGMINISKLPSGKYFFVYGISDSTGAELSDKEKKFYIYNPSVPVKPVARVASGEQTPVGSFRELEAVTSVELDNEFEIMLYLTTKEDRKFYKNLTNPEAKRKFILSIWQSKTGYQGLKGMNYREFYLSRVREANEHYKTTGKKGWKSDQGRVFILYGPPTNIERFPSTPENKPYQIWTYNHLRGQGGVIFVFADRFGFNRYELIQSTLRGELQDPFWQRYILMGTQQSLQN